MTPLNEGLSPHARGNPFSCTVVAQNERSIPARAGEPDPDQASGGQHEVYPRTRGGTCQSSGRRLPRAGLSPHARGNRSSGVLTVSPIRSIPARAGEP